MVKLGWALVGFACAIVWVLCWIGMAPWIIVALGTERVFNHARERYHAGQVRS